MTNEGGSRLKSAATGIVAVALSLFVGLVAVEYLARLVLEPVDFLLPRLEEDAILGHRIASGSGGHDRLGFRNRTVPDNVAIVAIGDSMTYGMNATRRESWPEALGTLLDRQVYNMGLPAYGPLHYLHLLETHAAAMSPDAVIIGLYIGNDLFDAYNLAQGYSHWSDYRIAAALEEAEGAGGFVAPAPTRRMLAGAREWLAGNSVVYRALTQSVIGQTLRRREIGSDPGDLVEVSVHGVSTFLLPSQVGQFVNLQDPRILAGLQITERALAEIAETASRLSIDVIAVVIPSKLRVFGELLDDALHGVPAEIGSVVAMEREVTDALTDLLESLGISTVTPLSLLQLSLESGKPPYGQFSSHPNALGYSLIAQAISACECWNN